MLKRFLLALAVVGFFATLHPDAFGQIAVGTKVMVSMNTTPATNILKEGDRTICELNELDWPCVVEKVNGDLLWIGDTKFHGWVQRGAVLSLDEAIAQTSEALRREPIAYYYAWRGAAWEAKDEYDLAIKDDSDAIRLDPTKGLYYRNRGQSWLKKGDAQTAIGDLTQGIRLSAENPVNQYESYRLRADAYEKLGDQKAAESDRADAERVKASIPNAM